MGVGAILKQSFKLVLIEQTELSDTRGKLL